MRENTAGPAEPIYDSRNSNEPGDRTKHSALASLMWQYVVELRMMAGIWPDSSQSLNLLADAMANVLEKNYGPREPK